MLATELTALRRARWRLDGRTARTGDDLREFVESCGLCLIFPERDLFFPTLIGAFTGDDEKLPASKHAFADPRAAETRELLQRLVRDKQAYRWPVPAHDAELVISASLFPYFYALAADIEGGQQPAWASSDRLSPLAQDSWKAMRYAAGPLSESRLREMLGGAVSPAALQRALGELWPRLRVVPIGESASEGVIWESLARWSPSVMSQAQETSREAALSAVLFGYIEAVVAIEQEELEKNLSFLISRSQMREAVSALVAQRELTLVQVERRRMLAVRGAIPEAAADEPQPAHADRAERRPRRL